ncbi:NADH dehydrogenase [ubiquinone] iron-sulfur protein 6, mitochondrial isoform X1 [Gorilla gorilla gorilla]|uniref:NADH dehydrogenase [ubiquinone] iron-sulfur protein 6, mitochondrial isoform X1 n=1 Tax=Gorilla gorilla gorilla TaxID=9595 RepID=UPI002445B477|nr:NADH dehydrogenase [ubiquinone] iron-sulfur protein 6, mitochondrial isoform X1 [Gorilla gorilla gorilla]
MPLPPAAPRATGGSGLAGHPRPWFCAGSAGRGKVVLSLTRRGGRPRVGTVVAACSGGSRPSRACGLWNGKSPQRAALAVDWLPIGDLWQPIIWVYDDKDYRRIRFVGRQKEVNENFAIDLIAEQPVSEVETRVIACDGGGGALGHPKVYINLDKETKTGTCGYCGLQFRQHHR